ncbi:MAG: hypothetical protein AAGI11_14165 [Pseudomonadota bacterium]
MAIRPETRLKQIESQWLVIALQDVPFVVGLGLSLHAFFSPGEAVLDVLNKPNVVHTLLVGCVLVLSFNAYRLFRLAMEKNRLLTVMAERDSNKPDDKA